ncbi:hypothetical protein O152_gp100 [Pseudomonas phage PaBG]|uniref:Uncharacterized protein n=1 Tax=Pseudomonas phage PaBG TaxID=1335230 RepID=S5VZJ5_9CAUD|nr:hypothetical protein O152_gp100 [Pseudomonas phage PaBG]AGS81985.1 hypothetical protein PaBG_00100 [Pseudomonas phage PaBG]
MTAESANAVLELTRQVSNLIQEGQFSLATAKLVETARADQTLYEAVLNNLKEYVLKGDIDDLIATVEMVR